MDMLPLLVETLQFSVGSVADLCVSSKLISTETYDTISETNATSAEKTRVLLRNVIRNISLNKSHLEDFVAVLEATDDNCQFLVEKLQNIAI